MNMYEKISKYSSENDMIKKDFDLLRGKSEDEIEDYLYEITQSLSKEEARNLIGTYLDVANKMGCSYRSPLFKTLLKFHNNLK